MSLLAAIKGLATKGAAWEHTVTAWFAKEYQSFRNEEPNLVALGDRVFPYVKSATQIALGLEGQPALAAEASALLDQIHAKADGAAALLYDFGPNPTVATSITTLQNDMVQFNALVGFKSTAAQDAMAKATNGLAALSTAIQGAIAAVAPPAA